MTIKHPYLKSLTVLLLLILSFFSAGSCFSEQSLIVTQERSYLLPDFDEGLLRGGKSKKRYDRYLGSKAKGGLKSEELKRNLALLRQAYDDSLSIINKNITDQAKSLHIPRIIHQIWLGSPVPEKYRAWMTTWMNWHGWEYKLWTDEEIKELQLLNQDIYDSVTNYGQKSDILRMELLYLLGGIYVDTDFECLDSGFFELLHTNVDFYVGVEPLEHASLRINNAIIGAAPGHPLLQKLLQELPEHFEANKNKWALVSTGPVFMTKVIYDYLSEDHSEVNMFLPCSLVYPFTSSEVDRSKSPKHLVPMEETVAIHYWSKSWVK